MKSLVIIALSLFLSSSVVFANNSNNPEVGDAKSTSTILTQGSKTQLVLPWADFNSVDMELVSFKNEYTLWKCQASEVKYYPGERIKGENFNYFVYKNGKFHLTVTEMNKSSVYSFFAK